MCVKLAEGNGRVKRYALLGAAGFIAPRHIMAIKETGGELVLACDPHDSVGILDSMFPDCLYFREFERFIRYIDMDGLIDYVVICTPNYLHDSQIKIALRQGCDVICEKPVVINPWNLAKLIEDEDGLDNRTSVILQLRLHPEIVKLKQVVTSGHIVKLDYVTPRGSWYNCSWKGDVERSGGLVVNIGVHLFDMLSYVFGKPLESVVYDTYNIVCGADMEKLMRVGGEIVLEKAEVEWMLSLDEDDKPKNIKTPGAYRRMTVDGREIDFSDITGLHTESYRHIVSGNGFGLHECIDSCVMTAAINHGRLNVSDVYKKWFPWWERKQ